jgi:predicted AAA+ superfamily ATPase
VGIVFYRTILKEFENWVNRNNRKPLIIRGARQVGKTTAVNIFSRQFDQYIYLNLELEEDKKLFQQQRDIEDLLESIFFIKNKKRMAGKTLIFIDEIQMVPEAVAQLRYFYEKAPDIYVIAAGSLLESLISRHINFPVGRVEFCVMHPLSFQEYLIATGEEEALKLLKNIPVPDFAYDRLLKLFNRYTLIGGMPEVVRTDADSRDIQQIRPLYEGLLVSYIDDVEKYASNQSMARIIRHIINNAFYEFGNRITYKGFGRSNYRSREMSEAFQLLEKTMFLRLIFPTTQTSLPVLEDRKKSPKLQILDTGLVNYYAGIQKELFQSDDISQFYEGRIAEHIIGQELLGLKSSLLHRMNFWVREKKQSNAEVDYVIAHNDNLIPVEVKSGPTGRLRSLHQFIDLAPHNYAIRFYSGKVQIDNIHTINKKHFHLLNLPYFLAGEIERYLDWFMRQVGR